MRTAWDFTVMPRSRSTSSRSRYCARITRSSTIPVYCSIRSASVDLPWSMWAMMQKLRRKAGSVELGVIAELESGVTIGTGGFPRWVGRGQVLCLWSHVPLVPGHGPARTRARYGPHAGTVRLLAGHAGGLGLRARVGERVDRSVSPFGGRAQVQQP